MSETLQNTQSVKMLNQKALVYYKQRKFDEAIQLWRKALEIDHLNTTVLYSLGIVHFEQKKYDEAIRYLQKVSEIAPDHHKALLVLGSAYLKLRKFDVAEGFIQKSLKLFPKNKMAYLNLGAIYSVRKEFDYAIEMFNKVIELDPNEARAYLGLGKIFSFLGNHQQANAYFQKIIELAPNSALAGYAKKALMSARKGEISDKDVEHYFSDAFRYYLNNYFLESAQNYEAYLELRPKDDLAHYFLAEVYLKIGQFKKGFLAFKNAIFNNPNKGLYYKELGLLLDKFGNPKDVLEVIKKAKALGKNDTVSLTLEGKNLNKLNQFKTAIETLEQAIKLDRNNVLARFELARAYIETGDFEMGNIQIQHILEMPVKSPLKRQAEKLLDTLKQSYTIVKN